MQCGEVWHPHISEVIKCQVQSMSGCVNGTTKPVMKLEKVPWHWVRDAWNEVPCSGYSTLRENKRQTVCQSGWVGGKW